MVVRDIQLVLTIFSFLQFIFSWYFRRKNSIYEPLHIPLSSYGAIHYLFYLVTLSGVVSTFDISIAFPDNG